MSLASNSLVNKPSLIEYENLRFLIMDAPKDTNLHIYLRECKKYNVTHIVRISEPSYSKEEVEAAGIQLHEMYYPDGQSPPPDIISRWLELVYSTFDKAGKDEKPCIAIHCVAGLGRCVSVLIFFILLLIFYFLFIFRAPVLVAIGLIEYGFDAISAVTFIRERRRGAINAVQLNYLESYKRTRKNDKKNCIIM
jgi:protein tyrosine phosphatase type 4A